MLVCGFASSHVVKAIAALTSVAVVYAQTPVSKLLLPDPLLEARLQPGTLMQEGKVDIALHINVLEGEDGVNVIKKKTAVKPVVEVRDRNKLPVAGAAVTFTSPSNGAGAVFMNGSRSVTLVTDSTGRAAIAAMKPVGAGPFKINVSASFQGQVATATIAQTNFLTVAAATAAGVSAGTVASTGAAAASAGLSTGVIAAIVAGAAAVAVGVGVGVAHGSGSKPSAPPSVSIGVPGAVTIGGPH